MSLIRGRGGGRGERTYYISMSKDVLTKGVLFSESGTRGGGGGGRGRGFIVKNLRRD